MSMRLRVDKDRLDKLSLELGKAARATARDCVFVHEGPRVYMAERASVQTRTCQTCKHWECSPEALCGKLVDVLEILAVPSGKPRWSVSIKTPPDFGCNKWEKKS